MKNFLMCIIALSILQVHVLADESSNVLVDTSEAIEEALSILAASSDQAKINDFKGVRGKPKTGGVEVKIYFNNGSNDTYSCHRHEASDPMECH